MGKLRAKSIHERDDCIKTREIKFYMSDPHLRGLNIELEVGDILRGGGRFGEKSG
jgi:hypothetical protein